MILPLSYFGISLNFNKCNYSFIHFAFNTLAATQIKLHFRKGDCGVENVIEMRIEEYDAFALRSYSFAVHKTNSFFSWGTVALSLGIVAVSVLLNLETVSHLWLTREQLPILSTQSLAYPSPLTATLVCFSDTTDPSAVPSAKLYDQNGKRVTVLPVSQSAASLRNPQLAAFINGTFACLDVEGLVFDSDNPSYFLEVEATSAKVFIEAASIDSFIFGGKQQFLTW